MNCLYPVDESKITIHIHNMETDNINCEKVPQNCIINLWRTCFFSNYYQ